MPGDMVFERRFLDEYVPATGSADGDRMRKFVALQASAIASGQQPYTHTEATAANVVGGTKYAVADAQAHLDALVADGWFVVEDDGQYKPVPVDEA